MEFLEEGDKQGNQLVDNDIDITEDEHLLSPQISVNALFGNQSTIP